MRPDDGLARRFSVVTLPIALAALITGSPAVRLSPNAYRPDVAASECPHRWGVYIKAHGDTTLSDTMVSLAAGITDIPEFHDCQRFIVVDAAGASSYDSIYAVFGAWDMGRLYDSVRLHRDAVATPTIQSADSAAANLVNHTTFTPSIPAGDLSIPTTVGGRGYALVEIYAEGSYSPLHIAPGFNCVYFHQSGTTLMAKMVNFGRRERDCRLPVDYASIPGWPLQVRRTTNPAHPSDQDYPVAARWEWDARHRIQYFSVRCGAAWCEAGPAGFITASALTAPAAPPSGSTGTNWSRVFHIKGWFDEQQLAPPLGPSMPNPSPIRGAVIPDPRLNALTKTQFHSWQTVAYVAIEGADIGYGAKLNILPPAGLLTTSWPAMNKVEMCWGTWSACLPGVTQPPNVATPCASPDPYGMEAVDDQGVWWARITSSKGGIQYRCVRRRDHSQVGAQYPRPQGARWHWALGDEIVWVSCDMGCCEVERMGP